MNKKEIGSFGERQAVRMLQEKGFRILDTNWSCAVGELDIVARRGHLVAFVEVKTRRSLRYGRPAEAVTRQKQQRIRNAARVYMKTRNLHNVPIRFDVIEVYMDHIEYAF